MLGTRFFIFGSIIVLTIVEISGLTIERKRRSIPDLDEPLYNDYLPEDDDRQPSYLSEDPRYYASDSYDIAAENPWGPKNSDELESEQLIPMVRKRDGHSEDRLTKDETKTLFGKYLKEENSKVSDKDLHDMFHHGESKKNENKKRENTKKNLNNENNAITSSKKKRSVSDKAFQQSLKAALEANRVSIKKKRSTDEIMQASDPETKPEQLSPVNWLIERWELLETENAYLKDALDAATRAQITDNDPESLTAELASLSMADKVGNMISNSNEILEEATGGGDDKKEMAKKSDDRSDRNESDDTNEIDELISNPEVSEEEKAAVEDEYLNKLVNLEENMEEAQKLEERECEVVSNLMDGCQQISSKFGLRMDEEARTACNTHKLCYACSGSIGTGSCDALYERQAADMCANENDPLICVSQALSLLEVMQESHQKLSFTLLPLEVCQHSCALRYFDSYVAKGIHS